ncbi:hypothetical protein [Streptomyces sp. T028]|uniref:hypothetical protein n=1 Tax=Streptomyces sp. T028 TaxID=3394379 RepID=UPI003A85E779
MALLAWELTRINLPDATAAAWPWRLELLDVQSASTATTVAVGLILARAQYATAVRPMLGWRGRVIETDGMSDRLVWWVRLTNGSPHGATVEYPKYRVILRSEAAGNPPSEDDWLTREAAVLKLVAAGLVDGQDFEIRLLGPAHSLSNSGDDSRTVALFAPRAMAVVEDVHVRVRAVDQAGDTHQRVVHCMRSARREPTSPSPDQ